jgi:hypothetical protein
MTLQGLRSPMARVDIPKPRDSGRPAVLHQVACALDDEMHGADEQEPEQTQ